jgi:hypothetical protein
LFFLFLLLIVLKIGLAPSMIGIPPFMPLLIDSREGIEIDATSANFVLLTAAAMLQRLFLVVSEVAKISCRGRKTAIVKDQATTRSTACQIPTTPRP